MGGIPGDDMVLDYLSALHLQCKSVEPGEQPSFIKCSSHTYIYISGDSSAIK